MTQRKLGRKWEVDLIICLKRLDACRSSLEEYSRSAGKTKTLIFDFLKLEGDLETKLLPHPYLNYSNEEKLVFDQCFGKPLEVPKKLLMNITPREFLTKLEERYHLIKECLAYTKQSRFRNFQSKKKNEANTRTSRNGKVRNTNSRSGNKNQGFGRKSRSNRQTVRNNSKRKEGYHGRRTQ